MSALLFLIAILIVGFGYMLPSIVAHKKDNIKLVLCINIVAGWTVIGWAVAMILALSGNNLEDFKKCPACSELIKSEAKKCKFCQTIFPEI